MAELLPWAQHRFGLSGEPSERYFGGSSFGGICALYMAMRFPGEWAGVMVESPSFWAGDGRYMADVAQHDKGWPNRMYLAMGEFEYTGFRGTERVVSLLRTCKTESENLFNSEASTAEAKDVLPSPSSTEQQEDQDSFEELLSRGRQLDDSFEDIGPEGSEECCSVEELTEWARREKLGTKFVSAIGEVVKNGGLRKVNDKFLLEELNIRLLPMRRTILNAIKRKLVGNKTVRFGEVEKFEPILINKPKFSKCPWIDLAEIEERNDQATLRAAMRTWRFCATGLDGQEERSLMYDAFNAWKPKPKGILEMFQDMLEEGIVPRACPGEHTECQGKK
ncbi:unnamed protein product [Cladocopium goreaui]|uniref:Esterase n=1 Tax=Cladocopium goreaui TaxID=2562237 RepID=A0A9P1CDK6_9DINO|nr:unnamed protein product [Cladocopium goreaui]